MKNQHINIAVVGGNAVGKSTYIACLFQAMKDHLWAETHTYHLLDCPNVWEHYRDNDPKNQKPDGYMFNKSAWSSCFQAPILATGKRNACVANVRLTDFTDNENNDIVDIVSSNKSKSEKAMDFESCRFGFGYNPVLADYDAMILIIDPVSVIGRENLKDSKHCAGLDHRTSEYLKAYAEWIKVFGKKTKKMPVAVLLNKWNLLKTCLTEDEAKHFDVEKFIEPLGVTKILQEEFPKHKYFIASCVEDKGNQILYCDDKKVLNPFVWIANNIIKL